MYNQLVATQSAYNRLVMQIIFQRIFSPYVQNITFMRMPYDINKLNVKSVYVNGLRL